MPHPCTTWRPCRCLNPAIIARGAAEPPTSIARSAERSYRSGSSSRWRRIPIQIVGYPGGHGHPLLFEVLQQARRIEVWAGKDELRSHQGARIRVSPCVRVEHRHDREHRVLHRDPKAERAGAVPGRACGAPSSDANRARPSASRWCRTCNTSPTPRSPPARGRGTPQDRPRRGAPRRSPRPRARARSRCPRGTAPAAAAVTGRRSPRGRHRDVRCRRGRSRAGGD